MIHRDGKSAITICVRTILGALFLMWVVVLSAPHVYAERTLLSTDGQPLFTIHVAADADVTTRFAGEELQSHLEAVTGAVFNLVDLVPGNDLPETPTIYVGKNPWTESFVHELSDGPSVLGDQGFVIRQVGNAIVIAGDQPRGTLFGVYYFLDRYVGIRWFSPSFTHIPQTAELAINPPDDLQVPRFTYRQMFVNGADQYYRARNLLNGTAHGDVFSDPRVNVGTSDWLQTAHTFEQVVPFEQYHSGNHLLAMDEGTRQSAAARLTEIIRQRVASGQAPYYDFSQMDTSWSADPDSLAFASEHGGNLTAPILDMVNDAATRVKAAIPTARIGTLAYDFTERPPQNMSISDNVVITFAPIHKDHGYAIDHAENAKSRSNADGWADIVENIVVWDYLTDFTGAGYLMPYPNLYAMSESIQWYANHPSFKGYFGQLMHSREAPSIETGFDTLRTWLGARLLWDPNQDYHALIDEFIQGYYGDAAPYVAEYVKLLHDEFERNAGSLKGIATRLLAANFFTFDFAYRADELFTLAAQAVANDPVFSKHVKMARIELDYVILERAFIYRLEAEERGLEWDMDRQNRFDRFDASTAHVEHYAIDKPIALLKYYMGRNVR